MYFEGRLASGLEEICELFAEFIQRTNTDDVWVPSDPGPAYMPDDPMTHLLARFNSFQMRSRAFCRIWMPTDPDGMPRWHTTDQFEELCTCFRKTTISSF
jgi:hypothetical protein